MEMGSYRLSPQEHARRICSGLCLYCGVLGHVIVRCPLLPSVPQRTSPSLWPWDCAIDLLPGKEPPRARIYPLSEKETSAMEEYIKEALRQGYVRRSRSPASTSFFFIEKKDEGLRPCIDYRGLNAVMVKYSQPLPLIPPTIEKLCGSRIYTKLDLRSAYNLVRIRVGDEWKTAFSTTSGHFEYLVIPYRLANAPSCFQAFINYVLREYLWKFVVVYLDDILIYSKTISDHIQHVRTMLHRLLAHEQYVKAE